MAVLVALAEHPDALVMVLVLEAGPPDTQVMAVLVQQMGRQAHFRLVAQVQVEALVEAVVATPVVELDYWVKELLGRQLQVQTDKVVLVALMGLIQLADCMAEEARAILEVMVVTPIILLAQEALFALSGPVALGHSHQRVQVHLNFFEKT